MQTIVFNRIKGNSYYTNIQTCDTYEQSVGVMKAEFDKFTKEKGFDPRFSRLDEDEYHHAFISTYDMSDVIFMLNTDAEHPCGVEFNPFLEFAIMAQENGMLDE